MASKNDLKAKIAGLEAANGMLQRDNEAHRARESKRMRVEHAEKQRKLKEAEREERNKRIENIGAGLLPLKGATQWALVHEDGGKPGIEVFVPLSEHEERVVQDYLNGRDKLSQIALAAGALLDEARHWVYAPPIVSPFVHV